MYTVCATTMNIVLVLPFCFIISKQRINSKFLVFPPGAIAYSFARFGQGSGPIYLDEVRCAGTEPTLSVCPSNVIGIHDCSHFEDAGVGCTGEIPSQILEDWNRSIVALCN